MNTGIGICSSRYGYRYDLTSRTAVHSSAQGISLVTDQAQFCGFPISTVRGILDARGMQSRKGGTWNLCRCLAQCSKTLRLALKACPLAWDLAGSGLSPWL